LPPTGKLLRNWIHQRDKTVPVSGDNCVPDAVQGDCRPLQVIRVNDDGISQFAGLELPGAYPKMDTALRVANEI